MRVEFSIRASAAIAGGLREAAAWHQWAAAPVPPQGTIDLSLPHVPAMVRRRLGPMAKMVITVADDALQQAQLTDIPVVWVSRYGDADRSIALLRAQASDDPLSPTGFGLSVHNGIGAQHAILRRMVSNALCVAALDAVPAAGVVEAVGLLHEGASHVMLVCYDQPLPGEYARFCENPSTHFAWAVVLTHRTETWPGFALSTGPGHEGTHHDAPALHPSLQVLQLFLHEPLRERLSPRRTGGHWRWERLHA